MKKRPHFGMAEFFDRFSPTYDLQERWKYMWYKWLVNKILEDLKPVKPKAKILDLCSGTGFLAFTVAEEFPQSFVVGLDVSKGMISQAVRKDKFKNVTFVICPAEKIPFKKNTFDFVISNLGVSHSSDIDSTLKESSDILIKGGKIIYSLGLEPDKEHEKTVEKLRSENPEEVKIWDMEWEKSIKRVEKVSGKEYQRNHPLDRKPRRKEMITKMEKAGFQSIGFTPCYSKIFGVFKGVKAYK